MTRQSKTTTKHETIRHWAESREGHPATVKGTGKRGEPGVLRIDFPGYRGASSLKEISWDDFFKKFDHEQLAFVYQERTASGKPSRFCKIINRDTRRGRSTAKTGR
jgi:hypothetical protein